jgi:deazaflavin-dependent oxidoreductase (nitroreductase family)
MVGLAVAGMAFVMGMRAKFRPLQDAIRHRLLPPLNRRALRSAGTPGAYASVVRHVGRRSGTTRDVPVVTQVTEEGFVVALPYGTRPDWLRNVLAAGEAQVVREGVTHAVDRPEIVPRSVADPYFPASDRRSHRWFAIDEFLVMRRIPSTEMVDRTA